MKKYISLISLFTVLSFSTSIFASSEIDKKTVAECGKLAQNIAIQIGELTFPPLAKGESQDSRPSSPFTKGDLDPESNNNSYEPSETLKTKHGYNISTFPVTISTKKGDWECNYDVKFSINNKCTFVSISVSMCAGGVGYPKKK